MEANQRLISRHKEIDKELGLVSRKVLSKAKSHFSIANKIAAKYDKSWQTILNYANGQGSDGFLKEALLEDFKKLQ